jgi:hypothetical protein
MYNMLNLRIIIYIILSYINSWLGYKLTLYVQHTMHNLDLMYILLCIHMALNQNAALPHTLFLTRFLHHIPASEIQYFK